MSTVKTIEIVGPGCPRCRQAHRVVQHVVDQEGVEVEVRKVEDINRMLELGIFATPAIVVDGEIKLVGRAPKAAFVRKLLGVGE